MSWVGKTNELFFTNLYSNIKLMRARDDQLSWTTSNVYFKELRFVVVKDDAFLHGSFYFPFPRSEWRWQVRKLWFFVGCAIWHSSATMMKENDGRLLFNYRVLHWRTWDLCGKGGLLWWRKDFIELVLLDYFMMIYLYSNFSMV